MDEVMPDVTRALKDAVQKVFTDYADDLGGASLIGDLVVLAECYTASGAQVMRHFDSNVPSWRQLGMLESGAQTLRTEEIIAAVFGLRDDNAPEDDE